MASPSPLCTVSAREAAAANSDRHPSTESPFGRVMAKSPPARCSLASASPTAPKRAAFGPRTHQADKKSKKGGRPLREGPHPPPAATADRLRTGEPARCQMFGEIQKERQISW